MSFPRDGADMCHARDLMRAAGGKAMLVAKIERAEAIEALDEILDACDAIMVARGDLGVEVGDAAVPALAKTHDPHGAAKNKLAITATQMMESMITSPIPTRAEVSDVANAVIDGTDAVMLSAETAAGQYPVEAVEAMERVCSRRKKKNATSLDRRAVTRADSTGWKTPSPWRHVHRAPLAGQGHRRPDPIRLDRPVDVADQSRRADLRADARSRRAAKSPCSAASTRSFKPPRRSRKSCMNVPEDELRRRGAVSDRRPDHPHHRRADRQVGRHQHHEDCQSGEK